MKKLVFPFLLISLTLTSYRQPAAEGQDNLTSDLSINECGCEAAFTPVYQTLTVSSDKEYLERLNYIYESTSQNELNQRSSQSGNISVPLYGSGGFNTNKSKVKKLYSKYKSSLNYSLTVNEKLELTEVYSRSEDVQKSLDVWLSCIHECNDVPRLVQEEGADSSEVIVSFRMKPNEFLSADDKVKVRGIIYSGNLELHKSTIPRNRKINYSGTYTLTFKRKNNNQEKGFVRVDLAKGKIIPVTIPKVTNGPIVAEVTTKEIWTAKVNINVSKNFFDITKPDGTKQRITFPNQDRSHYKLGPNVLNIKTGLKNSDATVYDYFYSPATGGVRDFQKKGVKLEADGTLSLDCYMVTGAKKMTGTLTVIYGVTKLQCVENCPEE